jgi:hypothetical protein
MALSPDRLRHLVALAVSPGASEEESRSAAVLACRMLAQEEGLLERLCAPPPVAAPAQVRRHAGATRQPITRQAVPVSPPSPPAEPSPAPPTPAESTNGRVVVPRVVLKSKYHGNCAECHKDYDPGDPIAWAKNYPTIHAKCHAAPGNRPVKTHHTPKPQKTSSHGSRSEYGRPKPSGQAKFTW